MNRKRTRDHREILFQILVETILLSVSQHKKNPHLVFKGQHWLAECVLAYLQTSAMRFPTHWSIVHKGLFNVWVNSHTHTEYTHKLVHKDMPGYTTGYTLSTWTGFSSLPIHWSSCMQENAPCWLAVLCSQLPPKNIWLHITLAHFQTDHSITRIGGFLNLLIYYNANQGVGVCVMPVSWVNPWFHGGKYYY